MFYIGIDIGGMSIKGGLCDENGKILFRHTVKTDVYDKRSITEDLCVIVDELLAQAKLSADKLSGIGVGSPGAIDKANGVIKYSNNVVLHNVPVVKTLQEKYGVPSFIDNDANCAALGETVFGSGKGKNDVIMVTLGTGVGSGFIVDGKLYGGRANAGTEAGHTVIRTGGEACNCGRKGCWEAYASASALIRQTETAMKKNPESLMHRFAAEEGKISGKTAFLAAKEGDRAGRGVVRKYLKYVSEGLINLANVFRPEMIIVGGGISHEGDYIAKPLQRDMNRLAFGGKTNPPVKVALATLGNDAGLLGAAALSIRK